MGKDSRFVDNADGTVTDTQKGLMWKRTDSMLDLKKWVNYQESLDYVRGLNTQRHAGHENWRLPSREELESLYNEKYELKDRFGKIVHISEKFEPGCGFTIIAQMVSGRIRTWVLNLRTGEFQHPDGLWTLSESTRAVRSIT
ncbi:MAG: DUF1566 domain-containing protein [Nitrospinaceae bacterium]